VRRPLLAERVHDAVDPVGELVGVLQEDELGTVDAFEGLR
jgi:hypothetical protein